MEIKVNNYRLEGGSCSLTCGDEMYKSIGVH